MHNLKSKTVVDERFEIVERLGAGGMGVVYKARQISLDRIVALKVLLPHLLEDGNALARFQLEAQALAAMKHRNISLFYGYGLWHGRAPYIAMEFLDQADLATILLAEGNRLTWRRTLNIARQIAEGMSHAHHAGIIHRDLKPSNVFVLNVDGEESVKIADFGLAKLVDEVAADRQKLTKTGLAVGSPHYMSPEQIRGESASASCDVYALGCIMYQCLFGRPPYSATNLHELLAAHMEKKSPVPRADEAADIPALILDILRVALAKDHSDRYGSMDQLAQAISEALTVTVASRDSKSRYVPPSTEHAAREKRAPPQAALIVSSLLLCLMILCVVAFRPQLLGASRQYSPRRTQQDPVEKVRGLIEQAVTLKRAGDSERYQMVLSSIAVNVDPAVVSQEYKRLTRERQQEFAVSSAVALADWRPAQTKDGRVIAAVSTRMFDLEHYDEKTLWDCLWVRFDRRLESQHMAFWETCIAAAYEVLREGKTSKYRPYNLDWLQRALDHPIAKTPAECAVLASEVTAQANNKHPELAADPLIALCMNYCLADQSDLSAMPLRKAAFAFQPVIEDRDGNEFCYLSYKMLYEWIRGRPLDEQIAFFKQALLNEDIRSYWNVSDVSFRRRCEAALADALIRSGNADAAMKVYEHGVYVVTHQLLDTQTYHTGPYLEDTQLKIAELQMKRGQKAAAYATFKRIYESSIRGGASQFARYGMVTSDAENMKTEFLFRKRKPSIQWLSWTESTLDKTSASDPSLRARTRLNYGDALLAMGKVEPARQQYEKALKDVAQIESSATRHNWYVRALHRLGDLALSTGNKVVAESHYSTAEIGPASFDAQYWNVVASHQLVEGDVDAARKALWHGEKFELGLCEETECEYLYLKARTELAAGRRSVALDLARQSAREWEVCCFIQPENWLSPTYAETLKLVKELSP